MCREGAWFELTAEVTSVDRHSKPAARFRVWKILIKYLLLSFMGEKTPDERCISISRRKKRCIGQRR